MRQIYTVQYKDKEYDIEGDRPPTEQDMPMITGEAQDQSKPKSFLQQATTPIINKETAKQPGIFGEALRMAGRTLPMTTGVVGPVFSGMIPPIQREKMAPEEVSEYTTPLNLATTGGILAGGILPKAGGAVADLGKNIGNVANPANLAREVRGAMFGRKKELGQALDKAITTLSESKPGEVISLREPMFQIKAAMQDVENNPGLASEINQTLRKVKDPKIASKIRSLIDNPENASELSLRDAEDIKRAISQAPSLSRKGAQGKFANWTNGDIEMLDLVDEIKSAQSEVFPELSDVRKPYAEFMNNYRQVKNMFKPGRLVGSMKKGFGDVETEQLAKGILPKETYGNIKGYRGTRKALQYGAAATGLGLAGKGALSLFH